MDKIINTELISGIEDRPAVASFVDTVNRVATDAPDQHANLLAAVIEGSIRAIANLERRVEELEAR